LVDALYEARLKGDLSETKAESSAEVRTPAPARRGGLLDLVKTGAKPPGGNGGLASSTARPRLGRNVGFARTAMQLWSKNLHETCDDPTFADAIGASRKALKEVATEMIATARRRGLESEIKSAIEETTHIETADKAAAKATIVAERHINRFVMSLGVTQKPRENVFDASGIGAKPDEFQQDFVIGWLKSFYDQAVANAQSSDGLIHDAEQNARLGQILASMDVP
jgi:hypothetical protein